MKLLAKPNSSDWRKVDSVTRAHNHFSANQLSMNNKRISHLAKYVC